MRACAGAAVDAVIVQDLGVAQLVRAIAPALPIHASTQMTCTDAAARRARARARRRSASSSRASCRSTTSPPSARETDVELEVFVHGALCIAYSGQCLTSEAIGGRSANRGACAQACRLPYELVVDGVVRDLGDRAYLLSPEDLEASALVPELARLGVASLKIEGRLKGPEYVAATTRLYRARSTRRWRGAPARPRTSAHTALQMFTRGSGPGFLAGVDHQRLVDGRTCDHRGPPRRRRLVASGAVRGKRCVAMRLSAPIARGDGLLVEGGAGEGGRRPRVGHLRWTARRSSAPRRGARSRVWLGPDGASTRRRRRAPRVWKTSDPARERQRASRACGARIASASTCACGRRSASAASSRPCTRTRRPRDRGRRRARSSRPGPSRPAAEALREKLGRLGDTPFALGSLEVDLPAGAMIPLSSLNRARRALAEALARRSRARTRPSAGTAGSPRASRGRPTAPRRPPASSSSAAPSTRPRPRSTPGRTASTSTSSSSPAPATPSARSARARRRCTSRSPPRASASPARRRSTATSRTSPPTRSSSAAWAPARATGPAASMPRIGDFSLNVTNRLTAAVVLGARRRRLHAVVRPRRRAARRAARSDVRRRSPRSSCTTRCRSSTWSTA